MAPVQGSGRGRAEATSGSPVHVQATKLTAIETDIEKLDAENQRLTTEIHALRADAAAIEKIAREELKLVKPGEIVLSTPEN